MYLVAHIDQAICSETACRLCTQYCPEANTILYDNAAKTAFVAVDRCKGCEICVGICDDLAKHHAIKMIMITDLESPFELSKEGFRPEKWDGNHP
ncbi:MAG: pyruvate ferredoxin oxidoreductase [Nitrospiraceae bacterium]|nr:pyruvate ferredoxin oxidoreductase [Nitrospiraceae bacterium]